MDQSNRFDLNVSCNEDSDEEIVNLDDELLPPYVESQSDEKEEEFVEENDLSGEQFVESNENSNAIEAPYVGMSFESSKEVFDHLHNYGRVNGFQVIIRDSTASNDPNGDPYLKLRFKCSKSGVFKSRSTHPDRGATSAKTECPFKLNASRRSDGVWRVTTMELEHNHPCNPKCARFMPNYRFIDRKNRMRLLENDIAGVPITKNYTSFVVQFGGHENVPFDERDCRNFITKSRKMHMKHGDFFAMKKHFEEMSSGNNSNFWSSYDVDEEDGSLRNVFWSDGRSRAAFKEFNDVVSFDTTFITNRYKMPFAPFVGINHHGQSVLFGCALLGGQEISNFVWLFRAWLACMDGKAPQAIITDQCKSIGSAVRQVFPEARHRWCIWHIMRNARGALGTHRQWKNLQKDLQRTLHDTITIPDFEEAWTKMVVTYGLQGNKWCCDMYAARSKWVPVYFKGEFWAGMSSTQRSEGLNFFFKGYVNLNTTLKEFVTQYGFALSKRVNDESKASFSSVNSPIHCLTEHIFEEVFQKVYTNAKFKEFQKQVKDLTYNSSTLVVDDGDHREYEVLVRRLKYRSCRTFKVLMHMESKLMCCDCKNFEFRGILCSHILRVFHEEALEYVPEFYILDRWRKDIQRPYFTVPVPYYALLEKKPKEVEMYEKIQGLFNVVSGMALTNPSLFKEVCEGLNGWVKKGTEMRTSTLGLAVQSLDHIGKVYGRRFLQNRNEEVSNVGGDRDEANDNSPLVKDPADKRGRGRRAQRRVGYHIDKLRDRKGKSSASNLEPDASQTSHCHRTMPPPFQFGPVHTQQQFMPTQNFIMNPPFQFGPVHTQAPNTGVHPNMQSQLRFLQFAYNPSTQQ